MLGCKSISINCKSTYLATLIQICRPFISCDSVAALSVTTHKATRTATNLFKNDCDKLDFERRQGRARSEDVDDQIEPDEEPNDFQKSTVIRSRKMNVRMSWTMEAWMEVTRRATMATNRERRSKMRSLGVLIDDDMDPYGGDPTNTT
jgi:hypothetical protein